MSGRPRRSVRLRLTLLYGLLFLISGAVLLTITYALVAHRAGEALIGPVVKGRLFIESPGPPPPGDPGEPGSDDGPMLPADELKRLAREQHEAELSGLLVNSALALGIMTVLSVGLGWLMAGRMLRPLRTITRSVRHISATNLHRRLALAGPDDELKELGDTFDGLLGRLEASFRSQRQFVANASHELRTPLARQRTLVQLALSDLDASLASMRAAHERVLVANQQQERLIEALLTLAQGEAGPDRRDRVNLAMVAEHVLLLLGPEATRRGLSLDSTVDPAGMCGNLYLIERLVTNLVDNALRHNVPAGRVEVGIATSADRALLTVTNTGPVVPESEMERLFQPFQRLGAGRTSHDGGFGLGLSIVRAIATAHHATITAQPRPAGGIRVTVSFPGSPADLDPRSPVRTRDRVPARVPGP